MRFGTGKFVYELVEGWGQVPDDWNFHDAAGVSVDAQDNIYVFNRGVHPVVVFNREGKVLRTFGEGHFTTPHAITVAPDGSVFCDDSADHTVKKFDASGKLVMTLGTKDQPSETGYDWISSRVVKKSAGPFNRPTNVAVAPTGEIYVSDGYGNSRVHKFSPDGQLLLSWGEPGEGPGEFRLPHAVAVGPDGTVYVGDRENSRIQVFTPEGQYLREWRWLYRPCDIFLSADNLAYVSEFGYLALALPYTTIPPEGKRGSRVSVWDLNGNMLSCSSEGPDPTAPGYFYCAHGACVDSLGDLYVVETSYTASRKWTLVPSCHTLQKFQRV